MSENGKLDEPAHRRADFREGRPIALADGQEWQFRVPRVRMFPDGDRLGLESDQGPEFDALLKKFHDRGLIFDHLQTTMMLGRRLLLANYELGDDAVRSLMATDYRLDALEDDPIITGIRDMIQGVDAPRNPTAG